jgi:hypothetical protein
MKTRIIERADGGISIINLALKDKRVNETMAEFEARAFQSTIDKNLAFQGLPFTDIDDSEIPKDRVDRGSWELKSGKIKVNAAKKATADAAKQAKIDKIEALKTKLGLTDEDLEILRRK